MSIKKIKLHEYHFGFELQDIMDKVFETTGFNPIEGEKKGDRITLRFEQELPETALQSLEAKIKEIAPSFKFKKHKVKYVKKE